MIFDLFEFIIGLFKMLIYKAFYLTHLKYHLFSKISYKSQIRISEKGSFIADKNLTLRSGVKIRVNKGLLKIGKNCNFNYNCLINCRDGIEIGDNTIFGQNIMIYDHDHVIDETGAKRNEYTTAPIKIGKNVWIGSGVIILKGVTVGDNSVIAAGTLVRKDVPNNSVVYNKKEINIKII